MEKVYHLNLQKKQIFGAKIALLQCDPFRVPEIAGEIEKQYSSKAMELAWKREYRTFASEQWHM